MMSTVLFDLLCMQDIPSEISKPMMYTYANLCKYAKYTAGQCPTNYKNGLICCLVT